MQTELLEHTVSWNEHNSRNRLRLDVVDNNRPQSLHQCKCVIGVDCGGRTQIYGGTASELESRSLVEIANSNVPHLHLAALFRVISLEFQGDFWHRKTRVPGLSYGVVIVILGLAVKLVVWCGTLTVFKLPPLINHFVYLYVLTSDGRDYPGDGNGCEWNVGRTIEHRRAGHISIYLHTVHRRCRRFRTLNRSHVIGRRSVID